MDHQMPLTWISTDGGPLIVLDEQLLDAWGGIPLDDTDPATPNDYERTRTIRDYLGMLPVGDGWGVVLNDEPLATTWWALPDGDSSIFVRWLYAPNEATVREALQNLHDVAWETVGRAVGGSKRPMHHLRCGMVRARDS